MGLAGVTFFDIVVVKEGERERKVKDEMKENGLKMRGRSFGDILRGEPRTWKPRVRAPNQ